MHRIFRRVFWPSFFFFAVFLPLQSFEVLIPYTGLPERFVQPLWRALATLVWLLGGWVATVTINRFLVDFWLRRWHEKIAPALVRSLVFVSVFLIVLSGILALVYEKEITGLWAMSGGVGLILGIALQSMIADFFAGITINAEGSFKVGDHIEINNIRLGPKLLRGRVIDVNWHSTRLKTPEGDMLVVPNNLFNTTVITNLSAPGPERAFEISLYFDPSEPVERLCRILEAAALSTRELLRLPGPKALVGQINEKGQEYRVEAWFPQGKIREKEARSALMTNLHRHLNQAGIKTSRPVQEVWHTKVPPQAKDPLEEKIELLSQVDVFGVLSEMDRAVLAANLKEHQYHKGERIFSQGDPGESMFVIMEGLVRVKVEVEGQGRTVEVAELAPGKYVGEMSLFTGAPRSADVEAVSSAILYEITKETVSYLLEKNPSLSRRLFREIAVRQAQMIQKKDKSAEQHEREKRTVEKSTFRKVKDYFKGVTGGLFLVDEKKEPKLSAANAAHMGLLAPRTGIIAQRDLALASVVLGIGVPRPPRKATSEES